MEPTPLTSDQREHAAFLVYHAACEAATTYAEVRKADRIYRAALTALEGGAR